MVEHRTNEKIYTNRGFFLQKIPKIFIRLRFRKKSDFPRFIIIESLQDIKLDQLSPFLIEKIIFSRSNLKTIKKLRTRNLQVQVETKKHAENIQKKWRNLIISNAVPIHTQNQIPLKGVVRSKELSLATSEEIEAAFKKQGIKEYRRVTIR